MTELNLKLPTLEAAEADVRLLLSNGAIKLEVKVAAAQRIVTARKLALGIVTGEQSGDVGLAEKILVLSVNLPKGAANLLKRVG